MSLTTTCHGIRLTDSATWPYRQVAVAAREVFIRCFFPTEKSDLDRLLTLEDRLRRKATQAHKIFGGMNVISGEQLDVHYASTREELEKLQQENPELFLQNDLHARRKNSVSRLRQAMANKTLMRDVEELPGAAGSGFTQEIAESRLGILRKSR